MHQKGVFLCVLPDQTTKEAGVLGFPPLKLAKNYANGTMGLANTERTGNGKLPNMASN
jgi:hypothetical protein